MSMKGIVSPKNIINLSSSHKVLPANSLDKKSMLIRPIISSKQKSKRQKELQMNNNKSPIRNESKIEAKRIKNTKEKKKNYFQTLKDKIFSPGDIEPSKFESKNLKLLSELSQRLKNPDPKNNNITNLKNNKINEEIKQNINQLNKNININNNIKYLPEKQYYLSSKKTLILDLDETLVHSAFKSFFSKEDIVFNMQYDNKQHIIYVLKRPYVDEFLDKMSKLYEIVIFTASISDYANPLLNKLDPRRRICHRLFREHCTLNGNLFIKDLSKIGRDLKDTIIVDNNPISYLYNKDNGIPILTWHSSQSDNELIKIIPLLELLSKVDDVRVVIKKVVNGNLINYSEVNKLINSKKNNYNHNINNNNYYFYNGNGKEKYEENKNLFGLENNNLKSTHCIKKNTPLKKNTNNNNSSNSINNSLNLSLINHKFSNFYFNSNEKNTVGDKIRESLNGDFENRKISNLFEDKIYMEKYNNFYDLKFYSKPTKSFIDVRKNEELILPSNNYSTSSSKNLTIKKKNKKSFYNKLLEMKEKVNHDETERKSFSKIENYHKFSVGKSNRDNNNDINTMTLPSHSLDKKYFSLNSSLKNLLTKSINYTTKVATIYLQDKNNNNNSCLERNRTMENLSFLSNNNSFSNLINRNYSYEKNSSNDFRERFKSISGINFIKTKLFEI